MRKILFFHPSMIAETGNFGNKVRAKFFPFPEILSLASFTRRFIQNSILSLTMKIYQVSQKKLYIILNLYKLTLRLAIWKIFSRYKKPSVRNIFAKFRSDITTLSVFIEILIPRINKINKQRSFLQSNYCSKFKYR